MYFNSEIPRVYPDSDLSDGNEVLEWLVNLVEGEDIEDITGDMLDKMIMKGMNKYQSLSITIKPITFQ